MEKISFEEMARQVSARRKVELPWTAEDEARRMAKSKAERESHEAWILSHPQDAEEADSDEDDTEDEHDGEE